MKKVPWLLGLVVLGLIAYLLYHFATHRGTQARQVVVSADVGPDSIAAYERRVEELQARADEFRARMKAAGSLTRPEVQARLLGFEQQMKELRQAVREWRAGQNVTTSNEAYRQCILLYGRASGVCDAMAPDTMRGK